MTHAWRRWLAVPLLALAGLAGCGSSESTDPPPVDTSLTVAGLKFALTGATLTAVNATLPAPDASFAAPVVAINRSPAPTAAATVSVSAAEPFTAILVQPAGSASYVRVQLPAQTSLIGLSVFTDAAGGVSAPATGTIAVVSGTRTSRTASVTFLQPVTN